MKEKTLVKLYDSELNIMEYLWQEEEASAKQIALALEETIGWSKTTTYTVLKKCVEKGIVARREPGFFCTPLISREEAQQFATRELIDKMYDGSVDLLVASLLGNQTLSGEEIDKLKQLVQSLNKEREEV